VNGQDSKAEIFDECLSLEPLSSEEVSKYLAGGGSELAALREAVDADPVLQELAEIPRMLSIMSRVYQGADGNELAGQKGDPEERRKLIFGLYVEQMFQRKGTTALGSPKEKIIDALSWLAKEMRKHSQSVFLVEGLQPSWLGSRAERAAYGTLVALSVGLIIGLIPGALCWMSGGESNGVGNRVIGALTVVLIISLIVLAAVGLGCWSESPWRNGVTSGLIAGLLVGAGVGLVVWLGLWLNIGDTARRIFEASGGVAAGASTRLVFVASVGLVFGLLFGSIAGVLGALGVGSLNHIALVETISWKWSQCWKRSAPGAAVSLIFGLILSLILGLIFGVTVGNMTGLGLSLPTLIAGLFGALIFGLIFWLVNGLVGGFIDRVKVGKASPNQGIKLSQKNALATFLVALLAAGLISGLITDWIGGLVLGLILGLIVGLNRGGSAVIKHYVLRLILCLNGYTPFKFVKFLDQCAQLILLKKVGGGYIFIHRMLLDYFAEMPTQKLRRG
jgi:eukaryotic-like serine/threonine-protein kinase